MKFYSRIAIAILAFWTLACGFLGSAMSMQDTTMPAGQGSYNSLAEAATARGWRAEPANPANGGLDNWKLRVIPRDGEEIILTDNNRTQTISFTCDGGSLDDDACTAAVEQLCAAAFRTECDFED